jgi:hypothetical protein
MVEFGPILMLRHTLLEEAWRDYQNDIYECQRSVNAIGIFW